MLSILFAILTLTSTLPLTTSRPTPIPITLVNKCTYDVNPTIAAVNSAIVDLPVLAPGATRVEEFSPEFVGQIYSSSDPAGTIRALLSLPVGMRTIAKGAVRSRPL
jgi:hypothetical protein